MHAAEALIQSVKNRLLSSSERGAFAIELAALLLQASQKQLTRHEKRRYRVMARMMQDTNGRAFMTAMLDSSFRSENPTRIVQQLQNLLNDYGVPAFLTPFQKTLFYLFKSFGHHFPALCTKALQSLMQKETAALILPGETLPLIQHLRLRAQENLKVNLNRLGEAILGENEAEKRVLLYLQDLECPDIKVISIKISSIYSQINQLSYEASLEILKNRLRLLYRTCLRENKFINLDMEESRDLFLTADLFRELLDEPEFHSLSQGIALQSYLPESFAIQKTLTEWAERRLLKNGAPIRIRLVKGANLGMERVEASLKGWGEAPYSSKIESDANFKRMMEYGMQHAKAVHLGIASHNLFDIAYALLLRSQYSVEPYVGFEMLEGMAPHLTKTIYELTHDLLLYCPAARKEDFHTAMSYLMRRLDEQTSKDNFLPYLFDLHKGSPAWEKQATEFLTSLAFTPSELPHRTQNRLYTHTPIGTSFSNEPDTDLSLFQNRVWAISIFSEWATSKTFNLPLQLCGKEKTTKAHGLGQDPSKHDTLLHSYSLATPGDIDEALHYAKRSPPLKLYEKQERFFLLAERIRESRGALIGAMMAESGKIFTEADSEVSEAIDMAEYYGRMLPHIVTKAPRIAVVAPPWNFPLAIPTGGCLSAIGAGYSVILKPAPEAVLTGSLLAELFIKADLPLQFLPMRDEEEGSYLIRHPLVDTVILTGATSTARHFMKIRPRLRLFAETGGKNSMIVTSMADRDLAISDAVQSSFGYAGQKCSALSLLICEEEVYHDYKFRNLLRDAAQSLHVGSQWDPRTKVNPLIRPPSPHLLRALTTLEPHEEWLLEPLRDSKNPQLWSPGIKLGVQPGSFTHETELFGPLLGVMCAKDLTKGIEYANATPYGLTAGLHSLDKNEHLKWQQEIQAGNLFINRGITGAIVGRQPFGGTKASSFGIGMKGGGPHAILQLAEAPFEESLYSTWWENYFSKSHTLTHLIGQENRLFFRPHPRIFLFLQKGDSAEDIERLLSLARLANTSFIIYNPTDISIEGHTLVDFQEFSELVQKTPCARIRCLQTPPEQLAAIWAPTCACIDIAKPSPHGGYEFLHFVREVSLSYNSHRYGNLSTSLP